MEFTLFYIEFISNMISHTGIPYLLPFITVMLSGSKGHGMPEKYLRETHFLLSNKGHIKFHLTH